ncbi:hypothetical protein [Billgrantia endophytica]|uniref:Uncharacterized protein n=1 Tax=Billgrantia endophytica TaxID=2033802 RepID=A0A2N7UEE3_9GAMM|nr:hypothetical protein [Halomonas endophytica]PMR78790.1 hypothetical protein C1H69_00555 [Halomonas endophytica]
MCGLCGLLDGGAHWGDPLTGSGRPARQQRLRRLQALNRILSHYRLTLSDFHGSGFLLASATGKQVMVANLDDLWHRVEALCGRHPDPLSAELLAHLAEEASP